MLNVDRVIKLPRADQRPFQLKVKSADVRFGIGKKRLNVGGMFRLVVIYHWMKIAHYFIDYVIPLKEKESYCAATG